MKKTLSAAVGAALLATVPLAECHAAPLEKGSILRVAAQPGAQYAALYIAKEKGWLEAEFKADGISIAYSGFKSGPAMLESFAGGGQDIGVIGDTPIIIGRAAGIPLKAVSVIGAGAKRVAILLGNKTTAKSVADLKGLRIGTPKGTPAHQFLAAALQTGELALNDVKLINLPYPDSIVALASGDVDAVALVEPYVSDVEVRGFGRQLIDGEGLVLGTSVVFTTETFAQSNPDIVARVIKVLNRADIWRKDNAGEAVTILAKETKFSEAALSRALPKISTDPRLTPAVLADLNKTSTFLREGGLIKSDVNIESLLKGLVDDSYLARAQLQ